MDNHSALISKLVTTESNPLVRDVTVEVHYRQWQQSQNMPYPAEVELVVDGASLWEESRTGFSTPDEFPDDLFDNLALADPAAFDLEMAEYGRQSHHVVLAFFGLGATYSPEQPIMAINELAPGVHHVATDTTSIIVEQANGLVLLEAPLSPAYGSTLVDVAGDVSDKPISHIIQSHHHLDHASGVRSVVATGAELVMGPGVGDLWDQILTAESTIRPEPFSQAPVAVVRHEVAEGSSLTLDDDLNAITVYSAPGPHARDMLITAINTGDEIIVFNADLYNGGVGFTLALPGPSILFEALRTIGLIGANCDSELPMTIVSTHGVPLSLSDALAEVGASNVGC
jgi:glyoxylase-like metal-dependent hydrolase (beta-lactamase superfamily II)